MAKKKRLLIISQTFVPDPASVGQHVADVAMELARRGHDVRVYTSGRGYEDPSVKYPRRENLHGVDVRRLPLASFGKRSIPIRIVGLISFSTQVICRMLFTRRLGGIFFSTSPPLVGVVARIGKVLRGVPIAYWAMDLNPDQLIAMGKIRKQSLRARLLERINRGILKASALIVPLDRFMAARIQQRGDFQAKMLVMPPWPHEENLQPVDQATNPFRIKHALLGKFVIMYSGNHSPANPLATLLQAARRFEADDRVRFLFVGGGHGKKEVEAAIAAHALKNVISLPYQPLADLKWSLSAADVHVVAMGDNMVGVIHPCKVYGAMAVGRPVLYLGPRPSHIADLLEKHTFGWHVAHGDVDGAEQTLREIMQTPTEELQRMGTEAQEVLGRELSQKILCGRLVDRLEAVFGLK